MTIHVKVTEEHIYMGERSNCLLCPVALALYEATGRPWRVYRDWACPSDDSIEADLPDFVCDWINLFDCAGRAKPFEFGLVVPDHVVVATEGRP